MRLSNSKQPHVSEGALEPFGVGFIHLVADCPDIIVLYLLSFLQDIASNTSLGIKCIVSKTMHYNWVEWSSIEVFERALPYPSPSLSPTLQEMLVLHSYNSHNEYVLQKTAFNALHDEFYGRQVSIDSLYTHNTTQHTCT